MTGSTADLDTAAAVLEFARGEPAAADRGGQQAAGGGHLGGHALGRLPYRGGHRVGPRRDRVAGRRTRAPLVAEFSVTEFAAAIGLPTEAGKAGYLGEAVELRTGSAGSGPGWSGPAAGPLVARETIALSREAAAYVDLHVAHVAHKVRPAQLDRLVEEAIGRFMPEEAERRRRQAADGRCLHHRHPPALTAGAPARCTGARPRRRPRPRRRRHRRRPGAERAGLHRHPGRAPRGRGRRPRPPPAHPRPQHDRREPHPGR